MRARLADKRIVVCAGSGGVGKTTTTVNLGAALADLGYRVLVVDLDPQGNASTGLGINIRGLQASMYDVILSDVPIEDCVAFEDSPPGITSALASGARTVAVRALLPIPARDGLSRVPSLEGVDLDVITRVVGGGVVDLMDGRD